MSLKTYRQKRKFGKTPEPKGKVKKARDRLVFVVQKHQATHLHYDLRLEMDGVLKSWAVPKGPSLDPKQKRLAAHVEDHPLEYAQFEGVIPEGEYGAGEVIVWDQGYYEPVVNSKNRETELLKEFRKGEIKFILHGQKLTGEFVLVKFSKEPKNWLLIKKRDDGASNKDILAQEESVKSGKTIAEIGSKGVDNSSKLDHLIKKGKKSRMPHEIKPMLATLAEKPFDDPDWIYESKYDGYRVIAELRKGKIRLYSRNNQSFNKRYPEIVNALEKIPHQAVLDGEVVALDKSGMPSFQLLQNYAKKSGGTLIYFVFDLLYLDGYDLRSLPLVDRKEILAKIIPKNAHIKFSDHIEKQGKKLFKLAAKKGAEGIMAKKKTSQYVSRRSSNWLKFKTVMEQEAVIAGFTQPRGSRQKFGALILGVYNPNKELEYIGHTGTGFNEQTLGDLMSKIKPLITKKSPFKKVPVTNTPATWVRPKLVCQVKFSEWTKDGLMRHPVYVGLREGKKPGEVVRETSI